MKQSRLAAEALLGEIEAEGVGQLVRRVCSSESTPTDRNHFANVKIDLTRDIDDVLARERECLRDDMASEGKW